MSSILDYFPMPNPRERQVKALQFIEDSYHKGFRDIVISAPTGAGKSGIGMAAGFWAASLGQNEAYAPKAYYLVTQKLLQDQLEADKSRYLPGFQNVVLLKGADEYPCQHYKNCGVGGRISKGGCISRKDGSCTYKIQKSLFLDSQVGITNYAYFLQERKYAGQLINRRVLVADECHGIEHEVLRFVEIFVDRPTHKKWTGELHLPDIKTLEEYARWLSTVYLPILQELFDALKDLDEGAISTEQSSDLRELDGQICQIKRALESMAARPQDWIYWQAEDKDHEIEALQARPLDASAFFHSLFTESADLRIYMSAFPGSKDVFCRSLGLDPHQVAWANLRSTFPVANRPVHFIPVGSMSAKNRAEALPRMLSAVTKIVNSHQGQRGLIHCGSYELGERIKKNLDIESGRRIIFPTKADEREQALIDHLKSDDSVLISPSISEGYDFKDDMARYQIIAKVAYPMLGDKQIQARMQKDYDWYCMRAIMHMVQACGRIVRSDDDWGITYILDSDFERLYSRYRPLFPKWWVEALVFQR